MNEKLIWEFKNEQLDGQLLEVEKGILLFYPKGKMGLKDIQALFEKLNKYKKKNCCFLTLLVSNSKISSISRDARVFVVDKISKESLIDHAVSFGSNYLLANIVSIFTSVMSKVSLPHNVFKSEESAIQWAKSLRPEIIISD